jgi:hypothetical protein
MADAVRSSATPASGCIREHSRNRPFSTLSP